MKSKLVIILLVCSLAVLATAQERRRATPVDTPATATQAVNETRGDTARINAQRRAAAASHYVNENGFTVYVDTIQGTEWIDSTQISRVPKMDQPLLYAISAGVNLWDPLMRAFGQKYGIADVFAEMSFHNRYRAVFEAGLGQAHDTPSGMNYTYKSPLSVYFRIGGDYNFLYNSNPDYSVSVGLRYGFSPFSYSISNVTVNSPYWDESATFDIPSQRATAGWFEVGFGLRVKLWGPISAGWTFKYRSILHESKATYGKPWYIPGFGSRSSAISGSISVIYTIPFKQANKSADTAVIEDKAPVPAPEAETEQDNGL